MPATLMMRFGIVDSVMQAGRGRCRVLEFENVGVQLAERSVGDLFTCGSSLTSFHNGPYLNWTWHIIEGLEPSPFVWSGEAMTVLRNSNSIPALKPVHTPPHSPTSPLKANISHLIRVNLGELDCIRTTADLSLFTTSYAIEPYSKVAEIKADSYYTQLAPAAHIELGSSQRIITQESAAKRDVDIRFGAVLQIGPRSSDVCSILQ